MEPSSILSWRSLIPRHTHPVCDQHTVQFYDNQEFLVEKVCNFIAAGIEANEAVIIISRYENQIAYESELDCYPETVKTLVEKGQLIFFDARAALERITLNGLPDWNLFQSAFGEFLRSTQAKYPKIRAYGEMVDLLREQGNVEGMIQLEEFWNEIAKRFSISILCGYSMKGFAQESMIGSFEKVCLSHTNVLPSESYINDKAKEDQNRSVVILQRKAEALELEIKERKEIEQRYLKTEKELKEALHIKEEFLAMVSHELKTPLTSLKLYVQMQRRKLEKGDLRVFEKEAVLKLISTAETQTKRLDKLVESILDS